MKLQVKASLFGLRVSVGYKPKKKNGCDNHASRTQLRIVEQGLVELETFVVEHLADIKPKEPVKEPTSLGFGFTTVSTEDLDPAEVEEEWFEDEEEDDEDWEEE